MLDQGGKTLFNQWTSSPITWEEAQLFQKTLTPNLPKEGLVPSERSESRDEGTSTTPPRGARPEPAKGARPEPVEGVKAIAVPIGSLLADEKGGLLEFVVFVQSKKGECQDRFSVQLTTFTRSSKDILKILWMGAAHRIPYSVSKCLDDNDDPHIKTLARHSFYPTYHAFPFTYIANFFTTDPHVLTVNYYSTLDEAISKLPATIRYSFCARLAASSSGSVRCIASQTNTTPPILWKDHIRKPTPSELTKEITTEPSLP
ncbi:hypothetical protein CH352_05110 [Leptospira hartskeerlii]|uniref:Uncharacterized protein n=2 Tax=Leptospira hartskeerlii TaxID=2023177 RepID=A0A2M9XFY5_9LEPT|nr:hypothetical protein CH357_03345 [Leptospira hartskeerlii]PJZ34973.1 hypothetical protein CH352_05110 [Leptospira hartskeerlii]